MVVISANFGHPKRKYAKRRVKYNPEVKQLLDDGVLDKVEKFEDLPIIHTGCDTYASIYPQFKKYMKDHTVDEVVDYILSLTPEGKWTMSNGQDVHFILTGGEPLLGWQKFYVDLFEHPKMRDLKNVTFETNTTQPLRDDFKEYIESQDRFEITWSCSPKLSVSGEIWDDAINPDIARSYFDVSGSSMYFKFVVADSVDVDEVTRAVQEYRRAGIYVPISPWSRSKNTQPNTRRVQNWQWSEALLYPRFIHIFGNAWGT